MPVPSADEAALLASAAPCPAAGAGARWAPPRRAAAAACAAAALLCLCGAAGLRRAGGAAAPAGAQDASASPLHATVLQELRRRADAPAAGAPARALERAVGGKSGAEAPGYLQAAGEAPCDSAECEARRWRRWVSAGKPEQLSDGAGDGCEDMPAMDTCSLIVVFKDGVTEDKMRQFAAVQAGDADLQVMRSLNMMTLSFGTDNAKCCEAYDLVKTSGSPLVRGVEFDQPMSIR